MTCGCGRKNDPKRRYCGRCGENLSPCCARCEFVNDRIDRFCGGCGDLLVADTRAVAVTIAPAPVAAPAPPAAPVAVAGFSASELADLLNATAPAAPSEVVILPAASIGQDDLDKLFGAGT